MARRTATLASLLSAGVCLAISGPGAIAQTQPQEQQQAASGDDRAQAESGRLEALVERRLEQTERQQARLQEIKRRLAAGESAMAILADLRERGEMGVLGEMTRGPERPGQRRLRDAEPPRAGDADPQDYVLVRNRVMAFFERHAPELAERLRAEGDSEEARRAVLRLRREVERLIELREQGSEEFEPALVRLRNGMRIADVLGKVRAEAQAGTLTAEKLRDLRRDLTELVATQFDAQLAARAKWLERTSERLRGAREKLEREQAERSQRIEAEVQAMLDRATNQRDPQERREAGRERRRPR
ncbi:MAG: hypothetical protein RIE77_14765 [Phycisphaerales bacterium]|jgi:hypothetical protein